MQISKGFFFFLPVFQQHYYAKETLYYFKERLLSPHSPECNASAHDSQPLFGCSSSVPAAPSRYDQQL